ncbi:MAG: hypothetical protein BGN87_17855 [Rhizobiales bacterium 65-79]|jgi:enoyl-CoA hydratase|nr:enoyl-CoA hydratase/isomerase family protein [Hyphomicrobiales bacterium]OJU06817.1 MAG: hypothetical protein BGN87_17855 [Rhizobiales bacterium 65-79]
MGGVKVERRGRIVVAVLDNPPVNAFSDDMRRELLACIEDINDDEAAHVMILAAAGEKAFCAGADLNELRDLTPETRRERSEELTRTWLKIESIRIPVVCAIGGAAIGAGTVIASLCDYRIASEHAFFSYPEIDRGTVGGGGVFMRRTGVPPGVIREALYTGRRFSAAEALAVNLVDRVVPSSQLMETAERLADAMAAKSRQALILTKKAIVATETELDWEAAYRKTHPLAAEATRVLAAKKASSRED